MKKTILALVTAALTLGAFSSAYADDGHHHRVCHKVKVHGHWQNRCH
ncbi:hypothetical protein SAMN05414139_09313 [Burkholderia sp. D7]|nr:hypothetical protein SAMN05414139_09313 [Burkholderia sp. D7]